jgi:hypothetical protein
VTTPKWVRGGRHRQHRRAVVVQGGTGWYRVAGWVGCCRPPAPLTQRQAVGGAAADGVEPGIEQGIEPGIEQGIEHAEDAGRDA